MQWSTGSADRTGLQTDFTSCVKKFKLCKFICCFSCTFCNRAAAKERHKSSVCKLKQSSAIKICEQCFVCRSLVFCKTCSKCPKCCSQSSCRDQTSKLLDKMVGSGCKPNSSSNPKGGLPPSLSDPTQVNKKSHGHKLLCKSPQEQLPGRGIASAYIQKCNRNRTKPQISRLLQPTISSSKARQKVETYTGSEQTQSFSQGGEIQNGNPGNHPDFPPTRGMGHLNRFQGRLLSHTHTPEVSKISQISCPGPDLPVQSTSLWPLNSSYGVHCNSQGSEADGYKQGYKNPPVPRRLVGESQLPPPLPSTYPKAGPDLSGTGLVGECRKIRTRTQAGLRICRLSIRPPVRTGPTYSGPVASPSREDTDSPVTSGLSGPAVHVLDRPVNSHRKASPFRSTTYEAHTVAPQKQLEGTRISGESYSIAQITAPPLKVVAGGRQCATGSTITPLKACSANFYRRIKRRLGRSFKRTHCKRPLVTAGKQVTHKLSRTKSSVPSLKRIPGPLCKQYSTSGHRQYNSGGLHKQRGRHEVRPTLCLTMENPDLVYQETRDTESPTHSGSAERGGRQAVQIRTDHSNRVVPPSAGIRSNMLQVAPTSNRPLCHQIQQQATSLCVTLSGSHGLSSGCTQPTMGGSGPLCLPPNSHIGQGSGEVAGLPVQQNHSDRPRVAKHALVLGSGSHVQSNPTEFAQAAQSVDSALQPDPSQESDKSKSPCLAPRASAIKEHGFSEEVATRIEAPQRKSTRSVYEAKWAIFTKWCLSNKVDFRAPPVKAVADFLMYLFQDKKLQPSTIDGYRSAIADKLGNFPINISKDDNLTRLLDSFHRDRPRGRRGIPSWNLSLVLHQLSKPPFEPIGEASLKHLTFKTVFLLALGSGKRRSEIHAWQNKHIRHQSDWSRVSLYPSPSFLSKNQLAKEGPESVAPVVIPALAPTLDKSLKSDRSLCPVRALRYYLDRTSDLRQNKELVFVSFKKGFDKDISPATISSWIKQTVILCYELSDHDSHTLHQVKAHDVRAFAASKAFQSGVSLEQILSACHWKSHNTFTQFYLKDVAWADSELYHLGPVVAAQQIHQQSNT